MQMTAFRSFAANKDRRAAARFKLLEFKNKTGSCWSFDDWSQRSRSGDVFTVREFVVPTHRRMIDMIASAEMLRDVAAFAALVLFGTMVSLVLGGVGNFG